VAGIDSPFQVSMNNMPEVTLNQTLAIGMRPEHIEIVSQPGENTILCRAQQVMEGVTSINYHFHSVNGNNVKHELETIATKSSAPDIKENENYYLYMPPEHFIIISE